MLYVYFSPGQILTPFSPFMLSQFSGDNPTNSGLEQGHQAQLKSGWAHSEMCQDYPGVSTVSVSG